MHMNERSLAYSEYEHALAQPVHADIVPTSRENSGVVDSLLHPLAIVIRKVLTRAGRQELNLILIDDEENILQALDSGITIHSLYYSGGETLSTELMRKLPANVGVYEVARRTCKKLFENDKVTRIFALAHAPVTLKLDSLLETPRDIVALEDLTIAGNIGAIARTCAAFSVGGLILLNAEPVDVYDRRIIRASRGHIFSLPVVTATTAEFLHFCRENNLPILVAGQGENLLHEAVSLFKRMVIIFGSEKDGCSQMLTDAATLRVQIPTHSRVESLNVSTAAGIMLYNRLWFNLPQARR